MDSIRLLAMLWAATLVLDATPVRAADPAKGKEMAESLCARCHAVGPQGQSPRPEAPAFRTLKTRYPVDDLAESLAEGIVTGHNDMPEVQMEPEAIRNFIAYLKTL